MKTHNKKRGFTIVELVIVIAVIAILSAVLIPTFVGVVRKARLSSDESAVAHMNKFITVETVEDVNKIDTLEKLIDTLVEQGIAADETLKPLSKGYTYYWFYQKDVYNRIVLVNEKDEVVYPKDEKLATDFATAPDTDKFNLEGGIIYIELETDDRKAVEEALSIGRETITLSDDVKLKNEITIAEGANVTLDLGGNTITTAKSGGRSKYLNVGEGATLTIKNGTFAGRGVQVYDGATLTFDSTDVIVQSVDENGGAAIWIYEGGSVVINDGTFEAPNGGFNDDTTLADGPGVINNSGTVTINGGTFKTLDSGCYTVVNQAGAKLTINGGTFYGTRGCIADNGGEVIIDGGTFETSEKTTAWVVYTSAGNVQINGGTFKSGKDTQVVCVDQGATATAKITIKGGKFNNTNFAVSAEFNSYLNEINGTSTITEVSGGYQLSK